METGNEAVDKELEAYQIALLELVALAMGGKITKAQFVKEQERLSNAHLTKLYVLGGASLDEPANIKQLNEMKKPNKRAAQKLANDIYSGKYNKEEDSDGSAVATFLLLVGLSSFAEKIYNRFKGGYTSALSRVQRWVLKGLSSYNRGQIDSPTPLGQDDPRFVWRWGDTQKHCRHCRPLDGVVLTKSEWARLARAGVSPQSPDLECGGWNCQCSLRPTDEQSVGIDSVLSMLGV